MCQPATPYKVRHLKMGAKVAGALCACDSYIAFRMLVRTCVDISYFIFTFCECVVTVVSSHLQLYL